MTTIADQLRGGTREQLEHLSAALGVEDEWARALAEPEPAPAPQPAPRPAPRRQPRPGPEPRPASYPTSRRQPRPAPGPRTRTVQCRACGGQYTGEDGPGRPWGWYSVSVSVPAELGKNGKPYQWVGTYCCVRCLAAALPVLAAAEAQARDDYAADRPQRPAAPDTTNLGALMRQAPRGR